MTIKRQRLAGSDGSPYEVLEVPNKLVARVRRIAVLSPEQDPIQRAERAVQALSEAFTPWMRESVADLQRARELWVENPMGGEERTALYRAAHDLRGQSALYGFPLVARVSESLCRLMDGLGPQAPPAMIEKHVDAVRALVGQDARHDGTLIARTLVERLAELTRELTQTPAAPLPAG